MADVVKQLDLFGEEIRTKGEFIQGKVGKDNYDDFTEKFKPKLTTDDCYTPVEVYEAVLGWLGEKVDLEGRNIVRPFWPGGDYQAYDYKEDDVVVDNPPFSILAGIIRFYIERNIRFFLFAPQLTIFSSSSSSVTSIPCSCAVEYANGAKVNTGFVSNLFGDVLAMSAPDLRLRVKEAQELKAAKNGAASLPRYEYPPQVLTSSMLGYLSTHGIDFEIRRSEAVRISALASQKACGKTIFGSGFLITERKAAERKAAEEVIVWELSDAEREAVRRLSENNEMDN